MGLDGGTYITRSDVLRGQSWAMNAADSSRSTRGGTISHAATYRAKALDSKSDKQTRWSTCLLTGQPLSTGKVAACLLGSLYFYDAVIEFLLARTGVFLDDDSEERFANQLRQSSDLSHLQSKRDVFPVILPAQAAGIETSGVLSCPVTSLRTDSAPFSVLQPCGHIFSDRAISKMQDHSCTTCGATFRDDEVVPINPGPDKLKELKASLDARKARTKVTGKRKRKEAAAAEEPKQLLLEAA